MGEHIAQSLAAGLCKKGYDTVSLSSKVSATQKDSLRSLNWERSEDVERLKSHMIRMISKLGRSRPTSILCVKHSFYTETEVLKHFYRKLDEGPPGYGIKGPLSPGKWGEDVALQILAQLPVYGR